MLTFAERKLLYNRCDPAEPLAPEDDRNVDLDARSQAGSRVRGVVWVDRLAERIELAGRPTLELYTGLPGSGKSTELRRLAARLARADQANLLPVLVDAEETLDLTSKVDIVDVLAAVLAATDAAVLALEGRSPDLALQDGPLTRLWAWLSRTDVSLTSGQLGLPAGASLVVEMKTRPALRERVRGVVASHLSHFLNEVRAELERLERRAQAQGRAGLVVIVDSLEKLRGTSTSWHDVLNSAEQIFAGGAPYLRLPVHVLYTIPTALVSRRFERVQFMPMIKLQSRDGQPWAPGMQAAREIVRRRVPDAQLRELLGPDAEAQVNRLITWSGGYPRVLVQLLREVLAHSHPPLSASDLTRMLNEQRDAYRQIVPAEAFGWLAQVADEKFLTLNDDTQRPAVDLMLSNNVILRYQNDDLWYDLHPAVLEIPGIQAARQARKTRG